MKKYIEPKLETFSMETEEGILSGSGLNAHNHMHQGEGDGIGEQFANKRNPAIWGNGSVWD